MYCQNWQGNWQTVGSVHITEIINSRMELGAWLSADLSNRKNFLCLPARVHCVHSVHSLMSGPG
jgi:hypothetical protein